ncbi:polysaccharide biosynthesis/export family protein [Sphingomonas jatrophae]|uniref:Polysaccharide export outer membrane protein n=1 Tax=Sphingomonas jatrophae TaxID=1166337 RepID=A0A1I6MBM9_9SPHN|nr:polysaccharide biosynthesis/export family protein [Sphingomonas jatrophae]SFS13129.1 polysaccharide export outer membrane protein [Sphingomonas jatrophae]
MRADLGWLVLAAAGMLASCAPSLGPALSAGEFQARYPVAATALSPGSRIRLVLYGDEAMTGEYQVAPDGTVSLPLLGPIKAAGLTVEEFRRAAEAQLANGFYADASKRLSVQLVDVLPIYVYGEVGRPGAFPYAPDLTLGKAAALAGGYTYRANPKAVLIRRANGGQEVTVVADQALPLAPGDTVRIPERSF